MAIFAFVISNYWNTVLALNTILALVQKRILVPDPQWQPAMILKVQHMAFRHALYQADRMARIITEQFNVTSDKHSANAEKDSECLKNSLHRCPCCHCSKMNDTPLDQNIQDLFELLSAYDLATRNHMDMTDNVLMPTLATWLPHVATTHSDQYHHRIQQLLDHCMAIMWQIVRTDEAYTEQRRKLVNQLQHHLQQLTPVHLQGMDKEEHMLEPLQHMYFDVSLSEQVVINVWNQTNLNDWRIILPFTVSNIPNPYMRTLYLQSLSWAKNDMVPLVGKILYETVDPFVYDRLCIDLAQLKIRRASPYTTFW